MADVILPQLGETVTEGTITQWFKAVGDTVAEDEPLFEVSTDKVDTEVPSPVSGTLTEIRVEEGDTVEVGTVIAVVGDGDARTPARCGSRRRTCCSSRPGACSLLRPRSRHPNLLLLLLPSRHRLAAAPAPAAPAPRSCSRRCGTVGRQAGDNRLLSPVVRRLVNEHDLEPGRDHRHRPRRTHHP